MPIETSGRSAGYATADTRDTATAHRQGTAVSVFGGSAVPRHRPWPRSESHSPGSSCLGHTPPPTWCVTCVSCVSCPLLVLDVVERAAAIEVSSTLLTIPAAPLMGTAAGLMSLADQDPLPVLWVPAPDRPLGLPLERKAQLSNQPTVRISFGARLSSLATRCIVGIPRV